MNWSEYFYYDETSPSGLRWRKSIYAKPGHSVPIVKEGDTAGYKVKRPNGKPKCFVVTLDGIGIPAHQIVWVLFNGDIPEGMIVDHVDRNPWNNSIENLQTKTYAQNNRNRSISELNTSGKVGVGWHKHKGVVTHAYATCRGLDGKKFSKYFLISRYGKEEAWRLAVECRDKQIEKLNEQGAGYTDGHGT